ncbi:zf-RVT domain-containing protein, partial [Cephalotus follicularis]
LLHNSNLWTATSHGHLSWSWRQILRLRPLAKEHLIYKCGNGEHFSLWFDPWVHGDSVHALYGHRVIFEAGLSKHARVKDVIREDSTHWDKVGEVFSTACAFHGIRQRSLSVDWHNIVWHSRRIPKHAFILWLALRGAHRTKDKLLAFGVVHSVDCAFLCGETETLQHLFFQCPFSAMVWREVLLMCNIVRPLLPWVDEVLWMSTHARGSAFHHTMRRLAFAATVYHLWIERN